MLPSFGITEFLLIAIVALIVVGPKDLPLMMRRIGQMVGRAKEMAREFQSAFDDIAKQAELDELRKEIEDLKNENVLKQAQREFHDFERDVNAEVMKADKTPSDPTPDAKPADTPAEPAPKGDAA